MLDTIRGYVNDNGGTQSRAPPSDGGGVKHSQDKKVEVKYSRGYWTPKLSQAEWDLLNYAIDKELRSSDNVIDDGTKWLYKSEKGNKVFAIYGIGDGTEATVLYAVGGEEAASAVNVIDKEVDSFAQYIGKTSSEWLSLIRSKPKKQGNNSGNDGSKGHDGRNGELYDRTSERNGGRIVNESDRDSESGELKFSAEPNADELQAKINSAMTMSEAKRMIESAFKINGIYGFYDGKYRTADEWLKAEGSSEVELYIESEWSLQEKYINSNQDILDGEYYISDLLDAYLEGTLVGKEKPKAKRFDTSVSYGMEDSRFYSPQRIEQAESLLAVANEKVTNGNKEAVNEARAKLLLFAHNKGAAEALGLTQAELNKKLRSWSGYSATAKKLSEAANKGVALENRWTGVENCAYINKARISNEDINELVGSIEGDTNNYERRYIARVMLAADTHISYKGLRFIFESNKAVNERFKNGSGRTKGFFSAGNESVPDTIVCSYSSPDTVAHEMGHYIDVRFGRDLLGKETGSLFLTRGINEDMVRERHGEDGIQFMKNFKIFMDSLTNGNSNISSYTNDYAEVFARFFARFVEWVDNTATGRKSYSYESRMYSDNFTASQYVEFIKLLQEKAMLDAKYEAEHSTKYSQEPMTMKELEAENKKLKKQLEYWRNQTRKNPKKTVREGDVKELAKAIISSCETDIKPSAIVPDLMELGNYIVNEKELRYTEVHDMAESIATELVENATADMNEERIA